MKTTVSKLSYSEPQACLMEDALDAALCQTSAELQDLTEETSGIGTWW